MQKNARSKCHAEIWKGLCMNESLDGGFANLPLRESGGLSPLLLGVRSNFLSHKRQLSERCIVSEGEFTLF